MAVMLQAACLVNKAKKERRFCLPVLKEGLAIHTFIHATTLILTPIHTITRKSASHSQPGFVSSHQNMVIDERHTNAEYIRPMKQYRSASTIPPIVFAGLKYTALHEDYYLDES
jgi:hypothetical protein